MHESHPLLNRYVIPDMPSADELSPYLRQIDQNRWYSNFGPLVMQLEDRLALHLSTPDDVARNGRIHLTALMTCYHALQIGLKLFRLPPQAKVLVPAVTFPACPLAIRHAGGEPLFADVDAGTWHLTPATARRIAAKMPVHAVMPVAVYGVPVPVKEWDAFMADTGIPVIIDAAAAFEAQPVPANCLLAHSFHATKPFSVGEGGILISRKPELIDEARSISNFGSKIRITVRDGGNAKMSEMHAAVGLAQLDRWLDVKKRRAGVFKRYRTAIEKAGLDVTFQRGIENAIVSALMLKTSDGSAGKIIDFFLGRGVTAHRMYLPPLYQHPYFSDAVVANEQGEVLPSNAPLEEKMKRMTNSEMMQAAVFGIPCHAFLEDSDIAYVVDLLAQVLGKPMARSAQAR